MALNDNVQLILGGAQTLGQNLGPAIERQQPLSGPQKWLAEVLAGRMTPKQAAIAARIEQGGGGGGMVPQAPGGPQQAPDQGSPQMGPSAQVPPWMASMAQPGQMPAPAPQSAPTQAQQASQPLQAMSQPTASPAPDQSAGQQIPQFKTQEDLDYLIKAAPFLRNSALSLDERAELERIKNQNALILQDKRNEGNLGVADTYVGGKTSEGQKNRDQRDQQFSGKMKLAYDQMQQQMAMLMLKLKSLDSRAKEGRDAQADLKMYEDLEKEFLSSQRNMAFLQGGMNAMDPNTQAQISELAQVSDSLERELQTRKDSIDQSRKIGPKPPTQLPPWAQPGFGR